MKNDTHNAAAAPTPAPPAKRKRGRAASPQPPAEKENLDLYWERLKPASLATRGPLALLPPSLVQKYLEVWDLTGVNVAFLALSFLLNNITDETGDDGEFLGYLEAGWLWHIEALGKQWAAREGRVPWWEVKSQQRAAQLAAEKLRAKQEKRAAAQKEVRP